MNINEIKSPQDILLYMKDNIKYGWLDVNNEQHIGNMTNFRKLYRTMSIEEIFKYKIGTCIEQVLLMKYLMDKINIPSKMFCTRIYEGKDFNNIEEEEHMHCFLLYYLNNKVYQIEHPNWERIGIYEFLNEDEAINNINEYYIKMVQGKSRPVTQYFDVPSNLSFKEFNIFINGIDENMDEGKNKYEIIPDYISPVRGIMEDDSNYSSRFIKNFTDAIKTKDAVLIMEGDWGGQIYLVCPMDLVKCNKKTLLKLLSDLDKMAWKCNEGDGQGIYFEVRKQGEGISGGMNGGIVKNILWIHDEFNDIKEDIKLIIEGKKEKL